MKLHSKLVLAAAVFAAGLSAQSTKGDYLAYVGTYTKPNQSKGIYAWRFSPSTGKMTSVGLVAETASPSFLALHPSRKFLYAVNELSTFQGQKAGAVSAFSIDAATGQLHLLNQVSSRGDGPCHLAVDPTGKWLIVANYGGGSAAEYPIHPDGTLGEAATFLQHKGSSVDTQRQQGPHAHDAVFSPDGKTVFVLDLGLDQILHYTTAGLTPAAPPFSKIAAGSGPRHMVFAPSGHFAYLMTEMKASVVAMRYAAGDFEALQTLPTVPAADFKPTMSGAEIAIHPTGKFVYASTRGANIISVFAVDPTKGTLTAVDSTPTQGKTPRSFTIDPTGAYLFAANQDSDTIVQFRIDPKTGKLTPTGAVLANLSPVCVLFVK
jgi:6-phosphogluconolactonase